MSLENRHLEAILKNVEAGMQRSLPEKLPNYRTVEPRLYPSTNYIAAFWLITKTWQPNLKLCFSGS